MKKKKLSNIIIAICLCAAILSMLVIIILQKHSLHFENSSEEYRTTIESSSNSERISENKHPQHEKTTVQSASQINAIQLRKEVSNKASEVTSTQPEKKYPIHLLSKERLEGNAKAERKNYEFYYVPFLEKLGVSPDTIDELQNFTLTGQ